MVGSDTIVEAVNNAAEDSTIKAIVLRVDSPGGSALASDLMWHALENAKAKKPVVVSMGDVAASGGYYIACNANKIVAEPSTVTGSIGVFMGKPM
jgi:protease-4